MVPTQNAYDAFMESRSLAGDGTRSDEILGLHSWGSWLAWLW